MAPAHRKGETGENHEPERETALSVGADMPLRMQFVTLCTIISVSLAVGAWCWNTTLDIRELREQMKNITSRPDPWTGTDMANLIEWQASANTNVLWFNPLDVRAGKRPRTVGLRNDGSPLAMMGQ